jgi:DNA-binding transcriptional LysR family regulator
MRLRHIEVFHAVMQAGTVSGAAHLLHISQPAVTKILQHAEAQLGLPLFERTRGKFVPTPEALRLFVEVDKLHADLVGIRRLAGSLKAGAAQGVRLAATPTLGLTVVPLAMTRWRKLHDRSGERPGAAAGAGAAGGTASLPAGSGAGAGGPRLHLSTHHTQELVKALLLGEADMALALHDPHHPGIRAEALASAPMAALLPLRLPAARQGGPMALRDLPAEMIGLAGDDPLGNRVVAECEAHGVLPQMRITVQTYQLARALAEAGLALTVVDPFTAAAADRARVRVRPLEPALPVTLYLLSAHSAPLSQPARRLVKTLREAAELCLQPLAGDAQAGPVQGRAA